MRRAVVRLSTGDAARNAKTVGIGPIPEDAHWILPDELATQSSMWEFWRRAWSEPAWEKHRVTIHPRPGTATHGRGGFFVHGGATWGSASCIDLTYGMDSFAAAIRPLRNCHIPLKVSYHGITITPSP
ncbi:DUF2778 domain-containing protein [Myxococcota bacterium]